jgi:hypothetical protein
MTQPDNRTTRKIVLDDLLVALDQLDYGEDIDWPDPLPDDFEQLWLLRSMTVRYGRALYEVRRRIETALAHDLGDGGVARVGGDFVRYAGAPSLVVLPELQDWIEKNCTAAEALQIAPKLSKIRKTGLAAVLARHGFQTKGADGRDLLEGTFYVTEFGDPKISSMPVDNDNAPKYAAEMTSGEIRRRR